ncbi:MAG: DEAD/DEAH box helicase [Verrucomicrobiota bacterium]
MWQGSYDERSIPEKAGFEWNAAACQWETFSPVIAGQFAQYFDASAIELAARAEESKAVNAEFPAPAPTGLHYIGYQLAGIKFVYSHPNTLLADDMGLGKTIQAIGLVNSLPDVLTMLIVCPASLKLNWKRELEKWLTVPMGIGIVTGATTELPNTAITIVNYDLLHKHTWPQYDLLVLDEAQYCKSPTARRTKKALAIRATRKLFLTGTPILSRPIEIFNLIHALDPKAWPSRPSFGMRYCNGFVSGRGADFSGASQLDELHDKLRSTIMLRRLKADVLKELPPKCRQVIELPAAGAAVAIRKERKLRESIQAIVARGGAYSEQVAALKRARQEAFENLALVRHETALAKIPQVVQFIEDVLDDVAKVVVFAHHKDVIQQLKDHLTVVNSNQGVVRDVVVVTGDTTPAMRQAAVDRFQNDPSVRVFLGNIQAAGVGITLTAASHVIFAELDWVPGVMTQAEDRCHRYGQHDNVLVQHLVLEGSLDAHIARTLVEKQEILDQALDGVSPAAEAIDLLEVFK